MAFAALAIAINLLCQLVIFSLYGGPDALITAMGAGTAAGLLTKYYCDSRFIFQSSAISRADDVEKFGKYILTGVATTMVFWATEILFYLLWAQLYAKYIGAAVGLTTGYYMKYLLDRRYVFKQAEADL